MSRRLVVVLTLFAAISFGAAFSLAELPHKKGSTVLQKIHDAKAKGESYSPELWREAKAEYESARASGLMTRDYNLQGGSDSSTATVIGSSGYVDSGNTTGLGNNALFSSCLSGGADTSEDAWYVVTFVENVDLTTWTTCADVGPPSYDTRLGVFDSSLNIVGCNDDAADCGFPNYQSKIENLVLSPGTYYIVVDGYSGSEGPYELNVNWVNLGAPCFGSDASTATQITSLPFSHTSTTVDSCDNILVACELGGSSSGADVWYQIDLTESVYLDAWTSCNPGDIDTKIALLSLGQTEITCNDDDTTCVNGQSRIEDAYLSPGSYLIVVDSPLGGEGSYTVKVDTTHAPPGLNPDLLPDIIVLESSLYDNDIVTNIEPGRTHLRLSNTTANIGAGKLHLYGVDPGGSPPTQEVRQRIYRQDNSFYDQPAGYFLYHPTHGHIHVEHWSSFRLREILPGFGVGNIVAEGEKTSFCLLDLSVYDSSLPGFPPGGEFNSCGTATQGLSIGWADIYSKGLDGQWIDITDVPDGIYWLESMVDPQNNMVESDETNNTARIQVTIGTPTGGIPDRFEPNVDIATVDARPEGGPNSPNLGPVGPIMTVDALSVHQSTNDDYFRFYMPATGGFTNEIQIDFQDANGDLQLELQNIVGTPLGSSTGSGDTEVVSLQGIGTGYYYARVYGASGAINQGYTLTLDPPSNGTPSVIVTDPPAGTHPVLASKETYTIQWQTSDPEANDTWVTVYLNRQPVLDGNEIQLETSVNTQGALGFHIFNTAEFDLGTYYVYCEVTDGGTKSGSWAPGTLYLVDPVTGIGNEQGITQNVLLPNAPNPFYSSTTLRLQLAAPNQVQWRIYDLAGRQVREIFTGFMPEGQHVMTWDGRDSSGQEVAGGIYFNTVVVGNEKNVSKIVRVQ